MSFYKYLLPIVLVSTYVSCAWGMFGTLEKIPENNCALMSAIRAADLNKVKELIKEGVDINGVHVIDLAIGGEYLVWGPNLFTPFTPLNYAFERSFLVAPGDGCEAFLNRNSSEINVAYVPIIQELLAVKGVDVNVGGYCDRTPLYYVITRLKRDIGGEGLYKLLEILIAKGACYKFIDKRTCQKAYNESWSKVIQKAEKLGKAELCASMRTMQEKYIKECEVITANTPSIGNTVVAPVVNTIRSQASVAQTNTIQPVAQALGDSQQTVVAQTSNRTQQIQEMPRAQTQPKPIATLAPEYREQHQDESEVPTQIKKPVVTAQRKPHRQQTFRASSPIPVEVQSQVQRAAEQPIRSTSSLSSSYWMRGGAALLVCAGFYYIYQQWSNVGDEDGEGDTPID